MNIYAFARTRDATKKKLSSHYILRSQSGRSHSTKPHSIRTKWCVANLLMFSIFHQCFRLFSSWQWFCWRTRLSIFSQSHWIMAINHLSNDSSQKNSHFSFWKIASHSIFRIFYFHCPGRMVPEEQLIPCQSPPRILKCTINHFDAITSYTMYFRRVGIILMDEKKWSTSAFVVHLLHGKTKNSSTSRP